VTTRSARQEAEPFSVGRATVDGTEGDAEDIDEDDGEDDEDADLRRALKEHELQAGTEPFNLWIVRSRAQFVMPSCYLLDLVSVLLRSTYDDNGNSASQ